MSATEIVLINISKHLGNVFMEITQVGSHQIIIAGVDIVACQAHPVLVLLLTLLTDKLYFLLSIGLSRRFGHFHVFNGLKGQGAHVCRVVSSF